MATRTALNPQWEKAKTDFEKMTGKKKPKPNGLIAKAFNHTGVSGALKKCDQLIEAVDNEFRDQKKKAKLIKAAESYIKTVKKETDSYIKTLDKAIQSEINDKGDKTDYSRALKFLRTRLDALEKQHESDVSNRAIGVDKDMTATEKAAKMVQKSLLTRIASAAAGIKKIKAEPTVERFDEFFKPSDNIARQVQVQLVAAANAHKKNLLPGDAKKRVDPRHVADLMTPWQAGGKGEAKSDPQWQANDVLAKTAEFTKLLKLAIAYSDDLGAAS
jgi:hypothetical protein